MATSEPIRATASEADGDGAGVIVPVDLVAFCVSESDAVMGTPSFSGATVNYAALTQTNPNAYLGASATRSFAAPPLKPLEEGIHLHWALPDALTKGFVNGADPIAFPEAPNRWLVTRYLVDGASATQTSFVIESDTLLASLPPGEYAPLVPVKQQGGSAPAFAYLGASQPLASYTGVASGQSYREATGDTFSAVSNGTPQFAAYYPEGRASFGFLDRAADITGAAQLMYVVTGWYEDSQNDPAQIAGRQSKALVETHGWSVAAGDGDGDPAYTLYSGTVQGIAWDAAGSYVPPPGNQPVIDAVAAIGNTPSEAIAAYFRNILSPDNPLFEQVFAAFMQGQWDSLAVPAPDLIARLAEVMHDSQFQAIDSGSIFAIYQSDPDGSEHEAIALPKGLADALNQANVCRQNTLAVANHVLTYQWQVFADWYRYFNEQDPSGQAVIFNHFTQVLMPIWYGPNGNDGLQAEAQASLAACQATEAALEALVSQRAGLSVREVPGPRYWQPNDPMLLLTGDGLALASRYGGDQDHSDSGTLVCRTVDQIVSAVSIGGTGKTASDFAAQTLLDSNSLPYLAQCEALLAEALLLDTSIASSWSGVAQSTLTTALQALLAGEQQSVWTITTGTAPSPVEVNWWDGANPWIPLFLQWTVDFVPLQPTIVGTALENYAPDFFTANYSIEAGTGSFVAYTPSEPGGIFLDPAKASFTPTYSGQAILSATAIENLEQTLEQWLQKTSDPTLEEILQDLEAGTFVVQPLSGFTPALIDRLLQAQFSLVVPPGADISAQTLTQATAAIVGQSYSVGPSFNTAYNPIRAGYFQLSGFVVDAYGQQRQLQLQNFYTAESMTTVIDGKVEAGIAYAAPRVAQPARLLFDWMSAGAQSIEEMTAHPATSPVCGWILPNHLTGGFFLYDGGGEPLGSLQLNGATPPAVVWQSAPGDDATINQPIGDALADANPLLQAVALSLYDSTADYFQAYFRAVDTVHGTVNPQNLALDGGLAVLVGRPVALVQAALRLDLQGRPYLNQNYACLTADEWIDTDNGLEQVQFPVMLGDADRLDDGLIGFYLTDQAGSFDLATFYSQGAAPGSPGGVVAPTEETLTLTLTPKADDSDPPHLADETTLVLMLVDPRAPVHAVTGILPTEALEVPSDVASAALSSLEVYFLAAPVLRPASELAMPVPAAPGFGISFVEQYLEQGSPAWVTIPDISAATEGAVWRYTPQSLTEGWIRINQTQLEFALLNSSGKAVVTGGGTQNLTLVVSNAKPNTITFTPGVLAPEATPPQGSIFFIHFGDLVADDKVAEIGLAAEGWSFAAQSDSLYGAYWAATPTGGPVSLAPGASFEIGVTGLTAVDTLTQAKLYFDYYAVEGTASGVATDTVVVTGQS